MGLNDTPVGERIHIGIFGCTNSGKSSLINAITGQDLAVVSNISGTTTDPVKKAMELLPIGPVMLIDTPGIDDESELGIKRVEKTKGILLSVDIALLVIDGNIGVSAADKDLIELIKKMEIPFLVVYNKLDMGSDYGKDDADENVLYVSALHGTGIETLKNKIGLLYTSLKNDLFSYPIVSDIINTNDTVILVIPIDSSAPKGRLILPQQQTIRELLESGARTICVRPSELADTIAVILKGGIKPSLIITDSQAFKEVSAMVPEDILLTSFSILMARHKGNLFDAVKGIEALNQIKEGDKIIISEGCTHHRQCEDIGTVKIPAWIEKYTGVKPDYYFTSGNGFINDSQLENVKLIVHCGGCMLNQKEMQRRYKLAMDNNIPVTNYGILISYMNGILDRCMACFKKI